MRTGRFFPILAIGLFFYIYFGCMAPRVFCETTDNENIQPSTQVSNHWLTMETRYFTIQYEDSVNLNTVASRLNSRGLFSSGFFSSSETSSAAPEDKVAQRADRLLKHVEEMLDMYPPNLKLTIKIFKDEDSLVEAYFRMMGTRQRYQAFYIHQCQTIYTSEYGISDSVVSHEMAHAVIDNYFSANPPPKVAEILATYVDAHLE